MDAAFQALDFPGLDWGGYSREEVFDLLTEAALDSLDGTGADFAAQAPVHFTPLESRESDSPDTPDPAAFFALAERDGAAAALAAWEEAQFYSPDQPRDDRGRWSSGGGGGGDTASDPFRGGMTHAARSQTRTASAQAVRDFVAKGGPASGEEVAALGNHLARLTVAQLHALRAEHGLPAAGAWRMRRPDLVNALAGRFRDHRAALPTRAAKELAAAAAGGAFEGSRYTPGDSTHAVKHGRTGFTVSAHPDGRFHVWDTGLAHKGVHDTAAAAVAHAANPPAKPPPDYQPRTADVETAARQGTVADAAARRAGAEARQQARDRTAEDARTRAAGLPAGGGDPARYRHALETLAPDPNSRMRQDAVTHKVAEIFARTTDKADALREVRQMRGYQGGSKEAKEAIRSYVDQLYAPEPSPVAPGAGGGAGPKAGGFDPHAEAQAIHDLVGGHAAAMHAGATADEGGRGGGLNRKYPRMDAAHATARREVEAHVADLVARAPSATALRDVVRAYGLPSARGSKADLAQQLRDVLRQRMATAVRVYAAADHEPDPSEAHFAAQRPVRFVPFVQPAEAARA